MKKLKFLDLFNLNVDLKYAYKIDPLTPRAIEYLDLICASMQLLGREVTPKSVINVIMDEWEFTQLVKSTLFNFTRSKQAKDLRTMIQTIVVDDHFDYLLFHGFILGVLNLSLPKTTFTRTLPNLNDLFYLGHTEGESEPQYLHLTKGDSLIVQHNEDTISAPLLSDVMAHKFSCGYGFILIDSTKDQEYLPKLQKNCNIFEREKDLVICKGDFDFDIEQAILSKKIVYVHLPPSKASSIKADQFAQKLQKTLSEIKKGVEPYSLFAFYCDGVITENWHNTLGDLKQYKQGLNCFYMSPTLTKLPDNLFNDATYQILTDGAIAKKLTVTPRYEKLESFSSRFESLPRYHILLIHKDTLTQYGCHL